MILKSFVDSNTLIYAHDVSAGSKQVAAAECLLALWQSNRGRLSTQVLQEFYSKVTRKKVPFSSIKASEVVRQYAIWNVRATTPQTIIRVSEISEVWQTSDRRTTARLFDRGHQDP